MEEYEDFDSTIVEIKPRDAITGKKNKFNILNKKRLTRQELDAIFSDEYLF